MLVSMTMVEIFEINDLINIGRRDNNRSLVIVRDG